MSEFPAPLVPPEVDLRDFHFMPVEVARLRQSKQWLIAKRRPEIGFYAFNLWSSSWHERPAASIEDDDDVLADRAMCRPDKWPNFREEVLRGWIKCSDGRLYHPVVAEKALEAWSQKVAHRERMEAARKAKRTKRNQGITDQSQSNDRAATDQSKANDRPTDRSMDRSINALKGEGQGQGDSDAIASIAREEQANGHAQPNLLPEAMPDFPKFLKRKSKTDLATWEFDDRAREICAAENCDSALTNAAINDWAANAIHSKRHRPDPHAFLRNWCRNPNNARNGSASGHQHQGGRREPASFASAAADAARRLALGERRGS